MVLPHTPAGLFRCAIPWIFPAAFGGFLMPSSRMPLCWWRPETWPNFIHIAHKRGIPIAIINGRLTARSFKRYKLIRPIMAKMLAAVGWFGIQTQTIADRFIVLGAAKDRITICRR